MLEQVVQWLKDGDEDEAASLLAQCSLNYEYVDMFFELGSQRVHDLFDVNVEAPRKAMREIDTAPLIRERIEDAIRRCAQTASTPVRDIMWVPKFVTTVRTSAEEQISAMLDKLDSEHVRKAWDKALSRKSSDPEGAITAARAMLESACKYILDEEKIEYADDGDLPRLYHLTADLLRLAPNQHIERSVRLVLGNCQAVVNGLAAIRNTLGDAHGKSNSDIQAAAPYAELAVNLAGAVVTFIVSVWQSMRKED